MADKAGGRAGGRTDMAVRLKDGERGSGWEIGKEEVGGMGEGGGGGEEEGGGGAEEEEEEEGGVV